MKRLVVVILALVVIVSISVGFASGQAKSRMKNIKVLTGMTDGQVSQEMNNWNKALGVQCVYCHVQGDFASDENPKKATARDMAAMLKSVNTDFMKGAKKVNCAVCHRGVQVPADGVVAAAGK